MSQVADTVDVAPVKRRRQIAGLQVIVRQRRGEVIVDSVRSDLQAKRGTAAASEFCRRRASDSRDG